MFALPAQNPALYGVGELSGPLDLVITHLKGVKRGPMTRQLRVARTRPGKKARLSGSVLVAAAQWGFFVFGKIQVN